MKIANLSYRFELFLLQNLLLQRKYLLDRMRYRKYNLSQYVVLLLYGETVSDYHDYSTFQLDFHQICKTGSTYFFFITRVVSLEIETSTSYVSKASDVRIYAIATITDTGSGTCSDAKFCTRASCFFTATLLSSCNGFLSTTMKTNKYEDLMTATLSTTNTLRIKSDTFLHEKSNLSCLHWGTSASKSDSVGSATVGCRTVVRDDRFGFF